MEPILNFFIKPAFFFKFFADRGSSLRGEVHGQVRKYYRRNRFFSIEIAPSKSATQWLAGAETPLEAALAVVDVPLNSIVIAGYRHLKAQWCSHAQ
jgi:hypothetical protein